MASRRSVSVGGVVIGGGAPVVVQSMLTVPLKEETAAVEQAEHLKRAGCEIVRVAVPSRSSVSHLKRFISRSPLPVVADTHYDGRIAVEAVAAGCHKTVSYTHLTLPTKRIV